MMKQPFKDVVGGLHSLVTGLRITIGQFFKSNVTLQYPHQSVKMAPRFRGHIELVRDPATGRAICFACKACEKACPSDCITVDGAKREGEKKKSVTDFKLDFTKCSLCGSCVEACKSEAIRYSRAYNQASTNKEDYIMDLFKKLEDEARLNPIEPAPVSAPVASPAVATAPVTLAASPSAVAPANPPAPGGEVK